MALIFNGSGLQIYYCGCYREYHYIRNNSLVRKDENGRLHCPTGPAAIYRIGESGECREYCIHGVPHRSDGPAKVYGHTRKKEYWYEGRRISPEFYWRRREIMLKYYLKWVDWVMDPSTERGKRCVERLWREIEGFYLEYMSFYTVKPSQN